MRRLLLILLLLPTLALADAPQVVVSIKPLHSLVAGVMAGIDEPHLLVRGSDSPHTYNLRPSDGRALSRADAVVWVGPELESFMVRPLESLAPRARRLTAAELPDLTLLPTRTGGAWEHPAHEHDHAHDHHHGGPGYDAHIWLDPSNASVIVAATAAMLGEMDPANAARYQQNAQRVQARLQELENTLEQRLAPVREQPYLVFHDAYQYLEHRYRLNAAGSITVSAERSPGARRVAQLRDRIQRQGAVCIFQEPQFEPDLVRLLTRGVNVRVGELDPVGADLAPGPDAYFTLMERMAIELERCLSEG